jgi:diguanylate cyclase (GGDEF)-like protein
MNFCMPIRAKLFLSHVMAVLLVSGSIGTYFYTSASESLMDGLKERLQASAALISQTLDADILRTVQSEADIAQPGYVEALQKLRALKRMNPDIAFLYVMRQEGEKILFVVDSDETEQQALPGAEYPHQIANLIKGFTGVSVDNDIVTDEWGSFLSGYAPIKNSRGEFLVGLDMRADKVRNKSENLRISGFLSLLASVALAFLFAKYLAARFTGPIRLVIDRCAAIAAGNLEQRTINVRTGDELDQLLNAFNHMSTTLSLAEQKKQEAFTALQRSRDELEIRVLQRTADLNEVNNKLSNEIAQRIIAQNALLEAATVDPLTRLFNRRAMMERFEHEAARCHRNHVPFTVIAIDLDHFKTINDTRGHEAGDSILIEIGVRMKSMLRSQDSIARWGGEEFVILLPETERCSGRLVAEKIRARIGNAPFYVNGNEIQITASFGVAEFDQEAEINQVLKAADEAVYAAKKAGRNRVVMENDRGCNGDAA